MNDVGPISRDILCLACTQTGESLLEKYGETDILQKRHALKISN